MGGGDGGQGARAPQLLGCGGTQYKCPLPVLSNHHSNFHCSSEIDHFNKIHCLVQSVKRSLICFMQQFEDYNFQFPVLVVKT